MIVSKELIFLTIICVASLLHMHAQHNCQQYSCPQAVEIPNYSVSNFVEVTTQIDASITFNFDVTFNVPGQYTCLDLGVCTANTGGTSALNISYQSTDSIHLTANIELAFYGTGQYFGGFNNSQCHCGSEIIGGLQANGFVSGNVQINSGFKPSLASGFSAICVANACGGGGCTTPYRFYGSFILSHLNCTGNQVNTGIPLITPIQASTAPPTVFPTTGQPSFIRTTVNPSTAPTVAPSTLSPSTAPSILLRLSLHQ